jgi:hypothetical protein
VVRAGDPRPARARPPRPRLARVLAQGDRDHPRPLPNPGDQPRRRAGDPGPLQALEGQAVLQRGPRPTDRDDRNDTRDFAIGRLLTDANWQALLQIGQQTNERLLDSQLQACACAPDATTLARVVLPSRTPDGDPAPALRFGDPRAQALLAALCNFNHLFNGLSNRSLHALVSGFLPGYTPRQMTYDLRRLRANGLLVRIPATHRYQLTDDGRRLAVFFAKTYTRIVTPSLAELDPALPAEIADRAPLARAWHAYERALDQRIHDAALAA